MQSSTVLNEPIVILGAGVSGLINAHVLLKDGFTDITLISRDKSVGGTWARERVYDGLHINNVHGEYCYSSLEMAPPDKANKDGGRLSGMDMCNYMENYSQSFLEGKAKFQMETEILDVTRDETGMWHIKVKDLKTHALRVLSFSRLILATGGCSNPKIPDDLSQGAANKAGYHGLVIHSSEFGSRLNEILSIVKPRSELDDDESLEDERIVVIGGGKSAQDVSAKLTLEGRKAVIVFDTMNFFFAGPSPAPDFIRKSRLFGVFFPHFALNSRLERFLHTTTIGSAITRLLWKILGGVPLSAYKIPKDSPLRRTEPIFWSHRISDEGVARPTRFHALAVKGDIDVISPAYMSGYADDGKSIILSTGQLLKAKVVVLATGYKSSWDPIFSLKMQDELGISKHAPHTKVTRKWNYATLRNPPPSHPFNSQWTSSIYRGLVPAKNIERRDFAIAGGVLAANFGYTNEVCAHWIASYLHGDKMRLPSTAEEAIRIAEERAAWTKVRFPDVAAWSNISNTASLDFMTWHQAMDELMEDMYLPNGRSGGNWLTWPFKVVDAKELATLTDERRARREEAAISSYRG